MSRVSFQRTQVDTRMFRICVLGILAAVSVHNGPSGDNHSGTWSGQKQVTATCRVEQLHLMLRGAHHNSESTMFLNIRPEQEPDQGAIRNVHCVAFGGRIEADLVDELRAGNWLPISLVAEIEGQIVGHIGFSPLVLTGGVTTHLCLSLAPLAVLPDYQRQGIGQRLCREGFSMALKQGYAAIIVLGDPAYYGRFGFTHAAAAPLHCAFQCPALQALDLFPGVMDTFCKVGAVHVTYAPPFDRFI